MTPAEFLVLPAERLHAFSPLLRALWQEAQGDWKAAHETAQEIESPEGSWVHAYLHRRGGGTANAGYWYRRAGKPVARSGPEEEWQSIVASLLQHEHGES